MEVQYAMVIDSSRCFNCKACIISCQLENQVPYGLERNWIKPALTVSGQVPHFQPGNCMHCSRPTCVEACPTGATYKDKKDGMVKIKPGLCIGCESCIPACPYGARFRHPSTRIVDKCDFCAGRRALGRQPACVETCPTQARVFGDRKDPESRVAQLLKTNKTVRVVNPETDTRPEIYFVAKTAPMDWPKKAQAPTPIRLWQNFAGLFIKALTGVAGFGVLVMFGKHLLDRNELAENQNETESGGPP